MNLEWQPADPEVGGVVEPRSPAPGVHDIDAGAPVAEAAPTARMEPAAPVQRAGRSGRIGARLRILGAVVLGGIGGAAILGPVIANAASPAPTTVAGVPSTGTDADADNDANHHGGPGGPGFGGPAGLAGHVEAVSDTSVVAKAIGI
ncbi:MAG: hypothetical protein ACHQ3P_11985, partial [Candidatus Limnocylindrales bacterium]